MESGKKRDLHVEAPVEAADETIQRPVMVSTKPPYTIGFSISQLFIFIPGQKHSLGRYFGMSIFVSLGTVGVT